MLSKSKKITIYVVVFGGVFVSIYVFGPTFLKSLCGKRELLIIVKLRSIFLFFLVPLK